MKKGYMKNRYKLDADTNIIYDTKEYDSILNVVGRLNAQDKAIRNLKQQLSEKDKEIANCKARIEELAEQRENLCQETEMLKSWKETYYKYWKETQKQLQLIRHQVCEEIRDLLLEKVPLIFTETQYGDWVDILDQLDQIDQAKENIENE